MPEFLLFFVMLGELLADLRRYRKGTGLSDEEDINQKVVVITGANSGIGKYAAIEFAKRGATVVMGCRNLVKGQDALEEVKEVTGSKNVVLFKLDLEERESIKEFGSVVKNNFPEIKILLNNAGMCDFEDKHRTKDGCSTVMRVNYFGHVLLTNILLDNLKKGSPSRIINVLTTYLRLHGLKMEDLQMVKRLPWYRATRNVAYVNSKYALALFAKELGKRLQGTGVTTYSFCPGLIKTDFMEDEPKCIQCFFAVSFKIFGMSPEEGAQEFVNHLALSKSLSNKTGLMYRFRKPMDRINKYLDDNSAVMLWERTSKILNLASLDESFHKSTDSVVHHNI